MGLKAQELKGEERVSLWAYFKVLNLVSKLEEYPDPRSIIDYFIVPIKKLSICR